VVKERVRQIQTPPAVSLKVEYNLRGGVKPRWVPPAQSFQTGGESSSSLPETENAESPNQSLAFRSLALETLQSSGSSEEVFQEVYAGGFETNFQPLEASFPIPETSLPVPRFDFAEGAFLGSRDLTPIFNNPIYVSDLILQNFQTPSVPLL
jgi:hypothetical protein